MELLSEIAATKFTDRNLLNANKFVLLPRTFNFVPLNRILVDRVEQKLAATGFEDISPPSKKFYDFFDQYLDFGANCFLSDKLSGEKWRMGRREYLSKPDTSKRWEFWVFTSPDMSEVVEAMERFSDGLRPKNYGKPKSFYVLHPESNKPYPLKSVWALSTCGSTKPFTKDDALRRLEKLGLNCVDIRTEQDNQKFQSDIDKSRKSSREMRQARLDTAEIYAEKVVRTVLAYRRNPDVVAERLDIANGRCEECDDVAPFLKKKDSEPYLEVHHRIPLSQDGQDTVENTIALCPNCHREAHYG